MTDEYFMKLAIEEAKKSKEKIGCGSVLILNSQIITKSYNRQRELNDPTAHAEINVIRSAGKKLGSKNLDNCILYCTCEPCTMCLSAIVFAKIKKLFYGLSMKSVYPDHRPIDLSMSQVLEKTDNRLQIIGGFMIEECLKLL